jgi:hypothetical protein
MFGTCFVNAFDKARFIYLAYLALVTVLLTQVRGRQHAGRYLEASHARLLHCINPDLLHLMQSATNFCTSSFNLHGGAIVVKDQKQSALNAAAAGTVMLCICNYLVSQLSACCPAAA